MKRRYVAPGPKVTPPQLPRDVWKGGTFVEADGTVCEVIWNGHASGPTLCAERPEGRQRHERTIGNPVVRP